jgi:hypothetical protein
VPRPRRQARAQTPPWQEIASCETGLSWERLAIVRSLSFPGPRPDVHGPPSSAGFGISGFWVGRLLAAHRESARRSISLHDGIASLQAPVTPPRNSRGTHRHHSRSRPSQSVTRADTCRRSAAGQASSFALQLTRPPQPTPQPADSVVAILASCGGAGELPRPGTAVLRRMRWSGACGVRVGAAWLVTGPILNTRISGRAAGRCSGRKRGSSCLDDASPTRSVTTPQAHSDIGIIDGRRAWPQAPAPGPPLRRTRMTSGDAGAPRQPATSESTPCGRSDASSTAAAPSLETAICQIKKLNRPPR